MAEGTPFHVVMVVGRVGQGKTTLVSALTDSDCSSVKSSCKLQKHEWYLMGKPNRFLVDTPGFGDLSYSDDKIMKTLRTKSDGIDHVNAFIYVMNCSKRVTDYEIQTIQSLEEQFNNFLDHTVFVFTHGNTYSDVSNENFILQLPEKFKTKIDLADNRLVRIENSNGKDGRKENRQEIDRIKEHVQTIIDGKEQIDLQSSWPRLRQFFNIFGSGEDIENKSTENMFDGESDVLGNSFL